MINNSGFMNTGDSNERFLANFPPAPADASAPVALNALREIVELRSAYDEGKALLDDIHLALERDMPVTFILPEIVQPTDGEATE